MAKAKDKKEDKKDEASKDETPKDETPKDEKPSLKVSQKALGEQVTLAKKQRKTHARQIAIGSALGAFAGLHGVKEANKMYEKLELAGEGLNRVSG